MTIVHKTKHSKLERDKNGYKATFDFKSMLTEAVESKAERRGRKIGTVIGSIVGFIGVFLIMSGGLHLISLLSDGLFSWSWSFTTSVKIAAAWILILAPLLKWLSMRVKK